MGERIKIRIDPELKDLIPDFIANRHKDIAGILEALNGGNFAAVQSIGHGMKGAGGGYGFDEITGIGAAIEAAAKSGDAAKVRSELKNLAEYLDRIEIVYGDES